MRTRVVEAHPRRGGRGSYTHWKCVETRMTSTEVQRFFTLKIRWYFTVTRAEIDLNRGLSTPSPRQFINTVVSLKALTPRPKTLCTLNQMLPFGRNACAKKQRNLFGLRTVVEVPPPKKNDMSLAYGQTPRRVQVFPLHRKPIKPNLCFWCSHTVSSRRLSQCFALSLSRYFFHLSLSRSLSLDPWYVFFALPPSTPVATAVIFSEAIMNNLRLWCVAVCRSMLQYVTMCRSVLQCFLVCGTVLYCVVVWCNVFQCVSMYYCMLWCIAVYCSECSVLQCNPVFSSVFQRVAVENILVYQTQKNRFCPQDPKQASFYF